MKKLIFIIALFLTAKAGSAQTCYGKHSDEMLLGKTVDGVELYYRINHCLKGDEVLIQVKNTKSVTAKVKFSGTVVSANQIWEFPAPVTVELTAGQTMASPGTCVPTGSALELVSKEMFPNEYYPEHNAYPSILSFEFTAITVE